MLDSTTKDVELEAGKSTLVTFINKAMPGLQIRKTSENGQPLADAIFKITKANGTIIGEFSTDIGGLISIPSLSPGTYKVSEIKAPKGFLLDTATKDVVLEANKTAVVTFVNVQTPGMLIKKISPDGQALANATFKVTAPNGDTTEYTTDKTGVINITDLTAGKYKVTEVKAPDGYILETTTKEVAVEASKVVVVEFINNPNPGIIIRKVNENDQPLAGAIFKISTPDGKNIGEFSTDISGIVNITDLQPGTFIVSETKAPKGYVLDLNAKNVTVESGKHSIVTFVNKQKPGILIRKTDEYNKPLAGAVFLVTKSSGSEIGEFTTESTGTINIPDLDPDRYKITELKAPEGSSDE